LARRDIGQSRANAAAPVIAASMNQIAVIAPRTLPKSMLKARAQPYDAPGR
jgi:hypothetical protein